MNLQETDVEKAFRTSVREWMSANLCGEFEPLRNASGLGSPGYEPALAKRWEQHLAKGGWTGLGWPTQHGGRNLPLAQQVIFHEEYARSGGPGRLGHIGETLMAPTLMAHGSPELQARFLPGILAGETYWAQGYSEPGAGSDLAAVRTRARIDADTGAPTLSVPSVRALSKNTSLNSESPVIWRIGRIVTPGWRSGTSSSTKPLWRTEPASERASTKIQSDSCAHEVQTFWPSITHSPVSGSMRARVRTAAKSEPAPGSE